MHWVKQIDGRKVSQSRAIGRTSKGTIGQRCRSTKGLSADSLQMKKVFTVQRRLFLWRGEDYLFDICTSWVWCLYDNIRNLQRIMEKNNALQCVFLLPPFPPVGLKMLYMAKPWKWFPLRNRIFSFQFSFRKLGQGKFD